MAEKAIFFIFMMVSIISLMTVALTIFTSKKLNQHPSPLIARICIAEAMLAWNSFFKYFYPVLPICYLQTYKLLHWTTFGVVTYFDSFMIQIWACEVFIHLFQFLSLGLNLFLCVDLIQTLWNPFEVASKRLTSYLIISLTISTIFVVCIWEYSEKQQYENHRYIIFEKSKAQTANMFLAISLSIYIIIALYSMIFSIRRLNRPGVSPEIRRLFQRKHSAYVILFIIIWTVQLSASYFHLFNLDPYENSNADCQMDNFKESGALAVDYISGFTAFSTGIFLAAVRLYEPFFFFIIK